MGGAGRRCGGRAEAAGDPAAGTGFLRQLLVGRAFLGHDGGRPRGAGSGQGLGATRPGGGSPGRCLIFSALGANPTTGGGARAFRFVSPRGTTFCGARPSELGQQTAGPRGNVLSCLPREGWLRRGNGPRNGQTGGCPARGRAVSRGSAGGGRRHLLPTRRTRGRPFQIEGYRRTIRRGTHRRLPGLNPLPRTCGGGADLGGAKGKPGCCGIRVTARRFWPRVSSGPGRGVSGSDVETRAGT